MCYGKVVTTVVENMVKKNRSRFSHCGSFDHPNLQSLNESGFVFLGLPTEVLRIWGFFYYTARKVLKLHFQQCMPPQILKLHS
jgi:hypothetical protein